MYEFTALSADEQRWQTGNFITNQDFARYVSAPLLLYFNGILRHEHGAKLWTRPVRTMRRIYYRSIIYALRHYTRPIERMRLFSICIDEKDRTMRAIQKMWSLIEYEQRRDDFLYCQMMVGKYAQKHYKRTDFFVRASDDLVRFGVYRYVFNQKRYGQANIIELTPVGKEIIAMHRDEHYIF